MYTHTQEKGYILLKVRHIISLLIGNIGDGWGSYLIFFSPFLPFGCCLLPQVLKRWWQRWSIPVGLLHTAAVVAQHFALLTQMLRVFFTLIRNIQAIRLFQGSLLVRIDINVALDTFLSHVGPGISAHPFSLTFWTFVFTKTAFFPLVWCQAFSFWTCLWAVLDVMSLVKAEVTQIVGRWSLAGLSSFWWEGYVWEVFGEWTQAIHDIIKRAIRRCTLV